MCFCVLVRGDLGADWSTLHDGLANARILLLHEIWG